MCMSDILASKVEESREETNIGKMKTQEEKPPIVMDGLGQRERFGEYISYTIRSEMEQLASLVGTLCSIV